MARQHGRTLTSIWTDRDFIALPGLAQRMYLFLLSQPDLSHAGLIPLRTRRWASKSPGTTAADIEKELDRLAAARFVVVDYDTEELLIRTFVRNDGVYKQPKVMLRMREDARLIESATLKAAFSAELERLPLDELSDRPGGPNGDQPSTREVVREVVDTLRDDFAEAIAGVSGRVSVANPGESDGPTADDSVCAGQEADGRVSDTPGEGYAVPPRVRAGALPLPPTPVPQPPTPVPPTAGRDAARDVATPDEGSAQTLLAEWIDNCPQRPPGKVKGQVAKELKAMLDEGIPYEDVRAGLAAWHHKSLHPATLPSVVHEVRNPARPSGRPTTNDRVEAGLELARRLKAQEDQAEEAQALLEIESAS